MNNSTSKGETPVPALTLFVTGDAPRSRRARANLKAALEEQGRPDIEPLEVDLLEHPEATVSYSVFATPALVRSDAEGGMSVIYGDLSDQAKLKAFLEGL